MSDRVTEEYLMGIMEARSMFREHGAEIAIEELNALARLCKDFAASSPVGQMFRGERDFWRRVSKAKG